MRYIQIDCYYYHYQYHPFSSLQSTHSPQRCLSPLLHPERNLKLVQHFVPGVIVSVCHSVKVNCIKMRILIVHCSCIFNFNLFYLMFLLFRRALYKVAAVNFNVNKGLLLLYTKYHSKKSSIRHWIRPCCVCVCTNAVSEQGFRWTGVWTEDGRAEQA